jgi:hypothetical protein
MQFDGTNSVQFAPTSIVSVPLLWVTTMRSLTSIKCDFFKREIGLVRYEGVYCTEIGTNISISSSVIGFEKAETIGGGNENKSSCF